MSDGASQYEGFFERLGAHKQISFARQICAELIKGWGLRPEMNQFFRGEAETTHVGEITPEWLSEYAGCPVMFRAIRDYQLERVSGSGADRGIPDPLWLLDHRIDGPRTNRLWNRLWKDTREQFSNYPYVAACFRVGWGAHTLSLHNYDRVLNHFGTTDHPVRGGSMVWSTGQGVVILQYLRDLLSVLHANWRYGQD